MTLAFGDKQPYEAYYVEFDFVNDIDVDDTIASATVTVADSGGNDVTSTFTTVASQTISATKVGIWVKAGTDGMTYTITCKILTTTLAEKYEAEATLAVTET